MNTRRPAKVVRWREKRHDDSGQECEPARHLWSPCLSLCKPRACSQTKKETHCCGISPTRAGKKEKVRTAIELAKEEGESKRQVPASSCFEHGRRGPKKGVGDPALFYCRIGCPDSKTAAEGVGTLVFFVVGYTSQDFWLSYLIL